MTGSASAWSTTTASAGLDDASAPAAAQLLATLYCPDGHDRELTPDALHRPEAEQGLLWVDVAGSVDIGDLCARLHIPEAVRTRAFADGTSPRIGLDGDYVWCQVAVIVHAGELSFAGRMLRILGERAVHAVLAARPPTSSFEVPRGAVERARRRRPLGSTHRSSLGTPPRARVGCQNQHREH